MDVDNALTQSIAAQVRERIKGKQIQMKDMSLRTGIGLGSLSRYINGKRDIPASLFAIICADVDLDPGEVLRNAIEEFTRVNPAGN